MYSYIYITLEPKNKFLLKWLVKVRPKTVVAFCGKSLACAPVIKNK